MVNTATVRTTGKTVDKIPSMTEARVAAACVESKNPSLMLTAVWKDAVSQMDIRKRIASNIIVSAWIAVLRTIFLNSVPKTLFKALFSPWIKPLAPTTIVANDTRPMAMELLNSFSMTPRIRSVEPGK